MSSALFLPSALPNWGGGWFETDCPGGGFCLTIDRLVPFRGIIGNVVQSHNVPNAVR